MSYKYPFRDANEQLILSVWQKGDEIPSRDKDVWRTDICGKIIKYSDHGDTNSGYGWEIDHIQPKSEFGNDFIDNLQPLQWENNRSKGDSLTWKCP